MDPLLQPPGPTGCLTPARTSALPASPGFAAVPLHFPEVLEAELEEPCQRDLALTADLL